MKRSLLENGAILVEVVLVLPFMILIPMATFELARFMKVAQVVNTVSQEQALMAFRFCADFSEYRDNGAGELVPDDAETRRMTQGCVRWQEADDANGGPEVDRGIFFDTQIKGADMAGNPLRANSPGPAVIPGLIHKSVGIYRYTPKTDTGSETWGKLLQNFNSPNAPYNDDLSLTSNYSRFSAYPTIALQYSGANDPNIDSAKIKGTCNNEATPIGTIPFGTTITLPDGTTMAGPNRNTSNLPSRDVCSGRQRLVVSEVQYQYSSATVTDRATFGNYLLRLFIGSKDYREATVL